MLTIKERIDRLGLKKIYIADEISDDQIKVYSSELSNIINGTGTKAYREEMIKQKLLNYLADRERERGFDRENTD